MSRLTHESLHHFSGDLERYRHPLARRVIYTPGVKFVAEHGDAYWLIDELAFTITGGEFQRAGRSNPRILEMHFWRLYVKDNTAVLTARSDSDVEPFYSKEIPFTDFPLDRIDIWAALDGEHWTLYLPSEH